MKKRKCIKNTCTTFQWTANPMHHNRTRLIPLLFRPTQTLGFGPPKAVYSEDYQELKLKRCLFVRNRPKAISELSSALVSLAVTRRRRLLRGAKIPAVKPEEGIRGTPIPGSQDSVEIQAP